MLRSIAHRGPDGEGEHHERGGGYTVALGHRRLSIIDLEGGRQPLTTAAGDATIVFNGELFNFQDLRPGLERSGRAFVTRSDTEVVANHFALHGTAGLGDLNGMLAFAIWQPREQRLTLVRDRAGVKPLYYAPLPSGGIAFASELTALLAHPAISRRVDAQGLVDYFFHDYVQAPTTLLEGVYKLPPACFLEWQGGRIGEPRPFWQLRQTDPLLARRRHVVLADETLEKLERAVTRQLVADVPIGVFLSGGIDSSIVAALAQRGSPHRLRTFSIGFSDKAFDESRYARLVAQHIGSDHVERTIGPSDLHAILLPAIDHLDEPLADPSFIPTYLLSRLASEHVKVVLGGDGGDELFGGYPTYRAHRMAAVYAAIPRRLREAVVEPLVASLKVRSSHQSFEWKAKHFALRFDDDPVWRHLRWLSNTDLPDLARALSAGRGARPTNLTRSVASLPADGNRFLALDFLTYLPGSVLAKVDRASMAHGLEVRPPFLDNELVDWAFSLPASLKLRGDSGKYLLKLAASRHLPAEIIHRKKKGFGIPLVAWMWGPLRGAVESVLRESPAWDLGLLEQPVFAGWHDAHQARRADHSRSLWALLVLDRWLRRRDRDNSALRQVA